jgi:hypothetical protein
MAHYAYLDENNVVVTVTVGKDETETIDGLDTETYYALGTPYTVKRTSYNAATNGFRYNYAYIGGYYDPEADAFIEPPTECGHPELTLNTTNYRWECSNAEHPKEL